MLQAQEAQSPLLEHVSPDPEGPGVQVDPLLEAELPELELPELGHAPLPTPVLIPPGSTHAGHAVSRHALVVTEMLEGAPQALDAVQLVTEPPPERQATRQAQLVSPKHAW
jgi:hypothetical protein